LIQIQSYLTNRLSWRDWFTHSFENPWFFTHYGFLLVFGLFLLGYSFIHTKTLLRKSYLITFGLFFYYKSSGVFLLLFMGLIVCDYVFAQSIERIRDPEKRRALLVLSILTSLASLLYFKYAGFFMQTLNDLLRMDFKVPDLFLPIGISFYTFQSISYIVDVYQGRIHSSRNFLDYAFYMTFFPHLVAGPIVRAKDFIPQINLPTRLGDAGMKEGLFRIMTGLGKKLLLADFLARYVDMLHEDPGAFSGAENLFSVLAYSCQIYFDFSGYSDIAIGIAVLLGYRLNENFNNPYHAASITDFWRRWHISLSTWLRDYIYIPLGGNRKGKVKQYIFLMCTMTIGGLWHGASWKFVLWGIGHGLALVIHKIITSETHLQELPEKTRRRAWGGALTFLYVSFLWIFFRASNFESAIHSLSRIFLDQNWRDYVGFAVDRKEVLGMIVLSLSIVFIPVQVKGRLRSMFDRVPFWLLFPLLLLLLQLILEFRGTDIKPFIYFQF
jgi:alginate O-acetyltransferase complex protein AlgI